MGYRIHCIGDGMVDFFVICSHVLKVANKPTYDIIFL